MPEITPPIPPTIHDEIAEAFYYSDLTGQTEETRWDTYADLLETAGKRARSSPAYALQSEHSLVLIEDLEDYREPNWIWEGYLAPNRATLLIGHAKAGKTTLLAHLLATLSRATPGSRFFGMKIRPCRVLLISEEHHVHWARRRDELNFGHGQIYILKHNLRGTSVPDWCDFISDVARIIRANEIELVVFDTISSLWPVSNENDSMDVKSALVPLNPLRDLNVAMLLVHHAGKTFQAHGLGARGTTFIAQWPDILLSFSRHPEDPRRRLLAANSREPTTPETLTMSYDPVAAQYHTVESSEEQAEVERGVLYETLLTNLPSEPPGLTQGEIDELQLCSPRHAYRLVCQGISEGRIKKSGTGVRGNPYRYYT